MYVRSNNAGLMGLRRGMGDVEPTSAAQIPPVTNPSPLSTIYYLPPSGGRSFSSDSLFKPGVSIDDYFAAFADAEKNGWYVRGRGWKYYKQSQGCGLFYNPADPLAGFGMEPPGGYNNNYPVEMNTTCSMPQLQGLSWNTAAANQMLYQALVIGNDPCQGHAFDSVAGSITYANCDKKLTSDVDYTQPVWTDPATGKRMIGLKVIPAKAADNSLSNIQYVAGILANQIGRLAAAQGLTPAQGQIAIQNATNNQTILVAATRAFNAANPDLLTLGRLTTGEVVPGTFAQDAINAVLRSGGGLAPTVNVTEQPTGPYGSARIVTGTPAPVPAVLPAQPVQSQPAASSSTPSYATPPVQQTTVGTGTSTASPKNTAPSPYIATSYPPSQSAAASSTSAVVNMSAPSSGGVLDDAMAWVSANPLIAAGAAVALFFMFSGENRR